MKKTNPLSVSDIEGLCVTLRYWLKVPTDSCFPIIKLLNDLYYKGFINIQYMSDDDKIFEKDTPAKYNPIDNFIYIKESILEDLDNNKFSANFTLAHEFFHYIQHKLLGFNFEEVEKCLAFEDPEWQANEFAGQLLIPTKYVKNNYSVDYVAQKFKVSKICVLTRKLNYQKRQKIKYLYGVSV